MRLCVLSHWSQEGQRVKLRHRNKNGRMGVSVKSQETKQVSTGTIAAQHFFCMEKIVLSPRLSKYLIYMKRWMESFDLKYVYQQVTCYCWAAAAALLNPVTGSQFPSHPWLKVAALRTSPSILDSMKHKEAINTFKMPGKCDGGKLKSS